MIPYTVYKVFHLTGLFMVILGLGGLMLARLAGASLEKPIRRRAAITHGVGLLIVLIGGFGMLGGMSPMPLWVIGKLLVWLFLGAEMALILRKSEWVGKLWWLTILAAGFAAYLVVYKPGG